MHMVPDALVDGLDEGRLRFNHLYQEVLADREKNANAVEDLYQKYCIETLTSPRKEKVAVANTVTSVWEDVTDLI